jgi:uncharacterized protein YaaR (DUF327 family)
MAEVTRPGLVVRYTSSFNDEHDGLMWPSQEAWERERMQQAYELKYSIFYAWMSVTPWRPEPDDIEYDEELRALDDEVAAAEVHVRPFIGPLQEGQVRLDLAGKRKRDDDPEQKRQSLQMEVASIVMLLRVAEDTPGILQAADAIQNMKGYKELIQELTKEQVTSIMKSLTTTQNVDSRLTSMAKLSCAQHFAKIQTLENKCKILKSAFAKAMELSVLLNYVTETGQMNWNKITEDLGERLAALATAMED